MLTRIHQSLQVPGLSPRNFRNGIVGLLCIAFLAVSSLPAFAQAASGPNSAAVENQVRKFGKGKSVIMTLVGGEQVTGHIRAIGPNSFTVKVSKTHVERSIPYSQVTFIKDPPGPITWILIGAAIVIVVILIFHH